MNAAVVPVVQSMCGSVFRSVENAIKKLQPLRDMLKYLEISPEETHLTYIAKEALTVGMPRGWKQAFTEDGSKYFWNENTRKSQWEHPFDQRYRQMVWRCDRLRITLCEQVLASRAAGTAEAPSFILRAIVLRDMRLLRHVLTFTDPNRAFTEAGWPALHLAAASGFHAGVALLLRSKASVDAPDSENATALLAACSAGHDNVEVVQELLRAGASCALQEFQEQQLMPVHVAVLCGNTAIAKHLVDRDGPNVKTGSGSTVTELALETQNADLLEYLGVTPVERAPEVDREQQVEIEPEEPVVHEFWSAADGGDASAQFNLGWSYATGSGVEKDMVEAVKWYELAANQDLPVAQTSLGWCLEHGEGVPQDIYAAVAWYKRAGENGDVAAQHNMGWCYANGRGVRKDLAAAIQWYWKAAAQGYVVAQTSLMWCLEQTSGEPSAMFVEAEPANAPVKPTPPSGRERLAMEIMELVVSATVVNVLTHVRDAAVPVVEAEEEEVADESLPLCLAAEVGDLLTLQNLLDREPSVVNCRHSGTLTALHYVCGSASVLDVTTLECVKMLIEAGASWSLATPDGLTPLHLAASRNKTGTVKELLDLCNDCNATDNHGDSCLHFAAASNSDSSELVDLLLYAGADPHVRNEEGCTPYDLACEVDNEILRNALARGMRNFKRRLGLTEAEQEERNQRRREAAIRVQTVWRFFAAKRHVRELQALVIMREQSRNAVKIQALVRGVLCREAESHIARKTLSQQRLDRAMNHTGLMLQRACIVGLTRKRERKITALKMVTRICLAIRAHNARAAYRIEKEKEKSVATLLLQCAFRCHHARKQVKVFSIGPRATAATKLQNCMRIHFAQREAGIAQLARMVSTTFCHGHDNNCWLPFFPQFALVHGEGSQNVLAQLFNRGARDRDFQFVDDVIRSLHKQFQQTDVVDSYSSQLITLCNHHGLALVKENQLKPAMRLFLSAEVVCRRNPEQTKALLSWTLDNVALVHSVSRDFDMAIRYSKSAETIFGRPGVKEEAEARVTHLLHQAVILSRATNHAESFRSASMASAILQQGRLQDNSFLWQSGEQKPVSMQRTVLGYCYHLVSTQQFILGEVEIAARLSMSAAQLLGRQIPKVKMGKFTLENFKECFHLSCNTYNFDNLALEGAANWKLDKDTPDYSKIRLPNRRQERRRGGLVVGVSMEFPKWAARGSLRRQLDCLLPNQTAPAEVPKEQSRKKARKACSRQGSQQQLEPLKAKKTKQKRRIDVLDDRGQHEVLAHDWCCWLESAPVSFGLGQLRSEFQYLEQKLCDHEFHFILAELAALFPEFSVQYPTGRSMYSGKDAFHLAVLCNRCGLECMSKLDLFDLALEFFRRAETFTGPYSIDFPEKTSLRCWTMDNLACLMFVRHIPAAAKEHQLTAIQEASSCGVLHAEIVCLMHLSSILSALGSYEEASRTAASVLHKIQSNAQELQKVVGAPLLEQFQAFCHHMLFVGLSVCGNRVEARHSSKCVLDWNNSQRDAQTQDPRFIMCHHRCVQTAEPAHSRVPSQANRLSTTE